MAAAVRATFLGNDPWSVPTLERLQQSPDVDVVLVVTNPPRPAGRGSNLTSTTVADAARRLGLQLEEIATTRDAAFPVRLASLAPDVSVVVAYGELLSVDVLNTPRLGSVNLHLSLLPRWRGASPVQHAILAGDAVTGVTVIRMDEGMDTGNVLARRDEPVRSDDDAGSLGARLASLGADLVAEVLPALATGEFDGDPQTGEATFAPKLGPGDRRIDWHQPAEVVVRRVRAFAPDPGRDLDVPGRRPQAAPRRIGGCPDREAPPGPIVAVDREGVVVACGDGIVRAPRGGRVGTATDAGVRLGARRS